MIGWERLAAIAPALREAAERFGTPAYLTDERSLDEAVRTLEAAFPDPWLRHVSVKANDVVGIVRLLGRRGLGATVVSSGEWAIARRAGIPNGRIALEGIGKSDADLEAAVRAAARRRPLRWVAVESADEVAVLDAAARRAGLARSDRPIDLLLRLNPEVAPETHHGLAVGAGGSKFGLSETELSATAEALAADARAGGPLVVRGIHVHVGSQLRAIDAWRDGLRRALALFALLRGSIDTLDTLDAGGGFPVLPVDEPAPTPERFAREIPPLVEAIPPDRRPSRWAVEPGRALLARAGLLVARVLHVRERGDGRRVVLDAGMTELVRPALYGARHPVVALTSLGRPVDPASTAEQPGWEPARVDGPICESTDQLGEHRLPPVRRGDLVAILDAGAYAASMASTYNGRPRPPQLLLEPSGGLVLLRRRGSLRSLG